MGDRLREHRPDRDRRWLHEESIKLCKGKEPVDHMENFFRCVEDRTQPTSDVFTSHRTVSSCHLGNIAMLLGRKLRWDPEQEDFPDDPQASRLRSRLQREPYTISV